MTDDEALDLREELERLAREVAALRAGQDLLVSTLVARGDLAPGHPQLVEKVRSGEQRADRPRIYLGVLRDKYRVVGPDIDCASLFHLCRARCCTYSVQLTEQDLDEGAVKFELNRPYFLRHDADGYCAHFERTTGGCRTYERRPAACREYDCRQDRRVWLDFDQKLPAPFPPR